MQQRRTRLSWPLAATALACAILASLGFWQLQRLKLKEGLIARIEARAKLPPQPLPETSEWPALRSQDYEYGHVALHGVFEHDKEVLVFWPSGPGTTGIREPGFLIFTPIRLASGAAVIVNRGFVPQDLTDRISRAEGQTAVTGLMRAPESRSIFMPPDNPAGRRYFARDPVAIAADLGLGEAAPFLVDADDRPSQVDWPKAGTTELSLRNNHLSYALTWFGLAVACFGVFVTFAWQNR